MQPSLPPDPGVFRRGSLSRALRLRELGVSSSFHADVYTALVPSNTFIAVDDLPPVSLRRFTPCGRYLVAISDSLTDLFVFRFESGNCRSNWRGDLQPALPPPARPFAASSPRAGGLISIIDVPLAPPSDAHTWPPPSAPSRHSCSFARFFSRAYRSPVAPPGEMLARDFCLVSERGRFLILASLQRSVGPPGARAAGEPPPALRACPLLDRFSLLLVDVATGRVADRFVLEKDYVHLGDHPGVHMRRNLLCVLALRSQTLHLVRVQEALGRFACERRIGPVCRDDDEHELLRTGPVPAPRAPDAETGLGGGKRAEGAFGGLMHKLLAYVFRKYAREGNVRKVFRVLAQYSMLVMLKAQLLDDDHLLVRLGTDEGGKSWDVEKQTCFFLVYCVSATSIVTVLENRSVALLRVLEQCADLFACDPATAAAEAPRRTADALEIQTAPQAGASARSAAFKKVRAELSRLPFPGAMRNASPYLDRRLFSYDLSRLNGGGREQAHGGCVTVKFTSTRTRAIRMRLATGTPAQSHHLLMSGASLQDVQMQARLEAQAAKAHRSFLFHPIYPFGISIVTGSTATSMNFHVIGHT